jgi:hypothetical protein
MNHLRFLTGSTGLDRPRFPCHLSRAVYWLVSEDQAEGGLFPLIGGSKVGTRNAIAMPLDEFRFGQNR